MVNSGLLIFREVAESWISGNSTKSREIIHKTRKIPQNSSVILSNTYLYNIFWNFTCTFTCCKLANLYWNFVTETSKQCPKSTGVDYVAKNCTALALMLKASPFNSALVHFWSVLLLLKEQMMTSVKKTWKTSVWSAQIRLISREICPKIPTKPVIFNPLLLGEVCPEDPAKSADFFQRSVPHNPTKLILTFFPWPIL